MSVIDQLKSEAEDPVVIVDQRGIITHVNESFGKIFHWQTADLIGKSLVVIIPQNLRDAHQMGFSRFFVT